MTLVLTSIGVLVVLLLLIRPRQRPHRPRPIPTSHGDTGQVARGPVWHSAAVVRVLDGDSVIVAQGRRKISLRLDAIDCPEGGQPWGDIAKYGLIKLIGGKNIRFETHARDRYGRTVATVYVQVPGSPDWINVNARMVTRGHAWVYRQFYQHLPDDRKAELNRLERWARENKVGLWKLPDPVPPWQWRNGADQPRTRHATTSRWRVACNPAGKE